MSTCSTSERSSSTLTATQLPKWQGRPERIAAASRAMRRIRCFPASDVTPLPIAAASFL